MQFIVDWSPLVAGHNFPLIFIKLAQMVRLYCRDESINFTVFSNYSSILNPMSHWPINALRIIMIIIVITIVIIIGIVITIVIIIIITIVIIIVIVIVIIITINIIITIIRGKEA